MEAFTPGPWSHSFESVDPEWAIVTTSGGAVIANVNADHRQEANARLIAAAPDMLAMLSNLLEGGLIVGLTVEITGNARQAVSDLIAKTEGR